MKNIFRGILILIAALLLSSCNDNPSAVGVDLIPGSDDVIFKTVDTQTDTVRQSSSSFYKKIDLGVSETLILGKNSYAESSVLLRFDISAADSILNYFKNNSGSVSKAWIDIVPNYYLGDKSETLDFTGNQIKTEWSPSGFDADSLALLQLDNTNIVSNIQTTDSTVTFDINKTYAENWIRQLISGVEDNYGIFLKPAASTKRFIGFSAYSLYGSGNQPAMHIVVAKPNNLKPDTLIYQPYIDAHFVTGSIPVSPSGNIDFLQSGLAMRTFLFFDLSKIPANLAVNSARLELTLDTTKTFDGTPSSKYIAIRPLKDSTAMTLTSDSLTSAVLTRDGKIFTGDISRFVQDWVKNGNNQGMMLELSDETTSVSRIAFYNEKEQDRYLRPRLKIVFMQKK